MNDDLSVQIQEEVQKAITTSTHTFSPSSRSIFSPENLDPVIKLLVPTATPVRGVLPRTSGMGEAASWKKLTSRLENQAQVAGTGVSVGFADAGQPNETTQVYEYTSAVYKLLGRDVEIGRKQISANRGRNIEDIQAHMETVKTLEVLLGEEAMLLNGSAAANSLEFDGFAKSFTTNSGSAALLTSSGVSAYGQTLYEKGAELVSHLILNPRQNRSLSDQLEGSGSIQRVVIDNQGSAIGGVHLKQIVDGNTGNLIDVVTSRYAFTWAYLLTVQSPAGENWIEVEDLDALSIYDVPTSNHSVESRVFEHTVLKVIGEIFQYKIGGLAT